MWSWDAARRFGENSFSDWRVKDFMTAVSLQCKLKNHHPEWSNVSPRPPSTALDVSDSEQGLQHDFYPMDNAQPPRSFREGCRTRGHLRLACTRLWRDCPREPRGTAERSASVGDELHHVQSGRQRRVICRQLLRAEELNTRARRLFRRERMY